jgi:hypothetical protein
MAAARRKSAARNSKPRPAKSAPRRARARSKTTKRPRTKTKARKRATAAKTKARAKPAARRRGFFHVEVQPREAFMAFKTQEIGRDGGIERVAGKRAGGAWSTQEWLIAKDQAHLERGTLIGDTVDARRVLTMLGSEPRHIRADRFTIHGHTGMPADASPTLAPRRAGPGSVRAPQKRRKWS